MDKDFILRELQTIEDSVNAIRASLEPDPPPPDRHLVRAGENLQAALDTYNRIELESNAVFVGSFFVRRNDTILYGNNGKLQGLSGPALTIPMELHDVTVVDLDANTNHNNTVILVGESSERQNSLALVPFNIAFNNVRILSHRGKRGFEINSRNTNLINCQVRDLYDLGARDSQGVAILNSPGNIIIQGGAYEAASENILVGGSRMRIPNIRPTNILIDSVEVSKPIGWKDVIPNVKNLIELKDGHDVIIRNIIGRNSWKSGQDGYAFVFTPTLGASLQNIQVIDCDIGNVGSIVQILGVDIDKENTVRSQISFRGGRYRTDKAQMGGRGIFALITGGPDYLDIENVDVIHDGSQFVYIGDNRPVNRLKSINSRWNTGQYGITINGMHQGNNSLGLVTDYMIDGNEVRINGMNTIQARNLRTNIPNNDFI